MKGIYLKIKNWLTHSCFWSHEYELVHTEERATAHQCKVCNKIKLNIY
jgi:hypothetical protein